MGATDKIIVTGAAGLVGQNLVLLRREAGYQRFVAIDKQQENLDLFARLNPGVESIAADVAEPGEWEQAFVGARAAVVLHAQITGKTN